MLFGGAVLAWLLLGPIAGARIMETEVPFFASTLLGAVLSVGLIFLYNLCATPYRQAVERADEAHKRTDDMQDRLNRLDAEVERMKAERPNLALTIEQLVTGGNGRDTVIAIGIRVANTGRMPSVAMDWSMDVLLADGTLVEPRLTHFTDGLSLTMESGQTVDLGDDDFIYKKTAPLLVGATVGGWIVGLIPVQETLSNYSVKVSCADVLGNRAEAELLSRNPGPSVQYHPMSGGKIV